MNEGEEKPEGVSLVHFPAQGECTTCPPSLGTLGQPGLVAAKVHCSDVCE